MSPMNQMALDAQMMVNAGVGNTVTTVGKSMIPVLTLADLTDAGYYVRPADEAVILHATNPDVEHRTLLLKGQPGVGKSELAKAMARAIRRSTGQCEYIETLLHAWTDDGQLFAGVDPASAAGVAAGAVPWQVALVKGVLWRAAECSLHMPVVVLLDEIDKAQTRTEALLLQFLQDGRVEGTDHHNGGKSIYANLANIIMVLTSNDQRDLADATKRRAFRYQMDYLPAAREIALLRQWTGCPVGAASAVVAAAGSIRKLGSTCSAQEMRNLLLDARRASTVETVAVLIQGTLMQQESDMPPAEIAKLASTLFTEFAVDAKAMRSSK